MKAPRIHPHGILSYFTRHATVANLLLALMIAAGLLAFPRMRAQFFPDVVIDNVTVSVAWQGAGAEDVDAAIVQVMEPTLLAVEGVESSAARSSEGSASITLEFESGWDMGRAADDVQVAVDAVSDLPDDAEDPRVRRGAWRDPVTDVVITGPVGVDQLGRFADEMVARLFTQGVTRTTIRGVVAPETIVEVPSLSLIRNDVTMEQIAGAIAEEAAADPAGDVSSGAARVRTGVAKRSADQIEGIVLRSNPDGSKLTIGDVAQVRVEGVDRARAYFVGDNPAVAINVARSAQGDAIDMQAQVEEVAAEMLLTLPTGVEIELIRTRAELITARLNMLLENGLQGLGLVLLLLFLFLNARTALWVAAGIPVAMMSALALMYAAGLTINMISLFALIITLGIVVDDAIVVGEHADFRARRLGEDPVTASENAARRMFPPVFSATITTVIAFFGLVAVGGRFGDLIADIPFTVIVVLLASLVECFLILPHHMSHALTHTAKEHWYDWPSRMVNRGFRWVRDHLFRGLMRLVVWARYPVLAGAVLILALQVSHFIRGDIQFRFFNAPEQGTLTGNFAMVPGATRDDTTAMMKILQQAVEDIGAKYEAEHGANPVVYAIAEVGGSAGRGLSGVEAKEPELLGSISVELLDADLRPYSSFTFVSDLQDAVPRHPLLEVISFRGGRFGPGGDALDVELFGASADTLKQAAEAVKVAVSQYPEVSAVEDSLAYDKEELVLELTPQGQALGFTIDGLGRVLRNRLNGIEAATYPDGMRSAAIRVELPNGELTADFLERVQMRTGAGEYVALADIVTVTSRTGFSTVRRENGIRLVSVTGDIDESDPARAEEIQRTLETEILPEVSQNHGVEFRISGLSEQQDEFMAGARMGLILTLIGIYLTLSWIFSSWTRPVVVMAVIPFGLVGAIYGHMQWGVPLSLFSVVGLIGMTGIIINDSIVLVTTIDEYARERGLLPAIIDGTADRLRPVLLTTLTTVLGLAPLLYEGSSQAQFLKPTVITLVYGLGFGLVLVLLVVPSLVAVQMDVGRRITALRRMLRSDHRLGWARGVVAAVALGAGGLFAATMGVALTNGTGLMQAFATFLGGVLALSLVAFLAVGIVARLRRKPA
ncbi:efflux RND transporter permease subunit [Aliiroseovarius subalbicans]|uniref:efflux RND transporter permease subunit n=1 Tax=Aliiroseovarius subalbicans TaxID=2925840 RepID=UPI001F58DB83|nr:efflux RND transporter permease subunit [Aliiroseovarius subalbicans]MCI2399580.1 efflux RND transporter permease subunit [Aliiroseovarius subalbicans]